MLKVLGWLLIVGGILGVISIFFSAPGFTAMLIGAILLVADAIRAKSRRREQQEL